MLLLSLVVLASTWDGTVHDAARARDIPVRVYLPDAKGPQPVILFSHGLGGSRENNPYLGEHWAQHGYVAVFMQHPGSDNHVWQDVDVAARYGALKDAASVQNFLLRAADVPAVLDTLTTWNATRGHPLEGRLDLAHVGMSGHSFGAVTTQAVSGQSFPLKRFTDPRIKAALLMSPSVPRRGSAESAFADVKLPWLLMTGTRDDSPIGLQTASSRLGVFPALPAGNKYELVLDNAEHSAFSDRALPGDEAPRNPNHHRAVQELSTAFFDAYLRGDAKARAWLDGDGPRSVLEKHDRWQRK
jgi:predicted dienelactone hydrolase